MTIQLQPLQISAMWEVIKFVAIEANNITVDRSHTFLNNLLTNLLSGKAQVWMTVTDDEKREIEAMVISYIQQEPLLNFNYLVLHSVYGFKPLSLELINRTMETYCKFAKACDCQKLVVMTTDARLLKLYKKLGLQNEVYVYSKDL